MHVWMTLGCREGSKMNKPIDLGQLEVAHGLKIVPGDHGLSGETESSGLFGRVDRWEWK